jgi:hypothetical protein
VIYKGEFVPQSCLKLSVSGPVWTMRSLAPWLYFSQNGSSLKGHSAEHRGG